MELYPKTISQGDAFAVKITGVENSIVPAAAALKREIRFSSCGKGCFIGIGAAGIDEKAGAYPVTVRAGKHHRKLNLTVRKGSFLTTSMTLPEEKVTLSPADLETVNEENNLLKSIFLAASERLWEGFFIIPLDDKITTPFGAKRIMNRTWTSVHRGVDIKGPEGAAVKASNSGRVVLSRSLFFGGNTIVLDHGQGIHTVYMHLSDMKVSSGDPVSKGDVIGLVGLTGRATGPHLHFGVKIADLSVNPLSLLQLKL